LANQFPAHVASAWIGNSVAVAVKHYLQVTEEHFWRAAGNSNVAQKAAQKAAQQLHETSGNELTRKQNEAAQCLTASEDNTNFPVAFDCFTSGGMGDTGLEPVTSSV
jgi:hypothetical protein